MWYTINQPRRASSLHFAMQAPARTLRNAEAHVRVVQTAESLVEAGTPAFKARLPFIRH